MRCASLAIALPMLLLVLGGCSLAFKGESRNLPSDRLDDYANKGPFPVHGVSPQSPGPRLFQQILKSPQLTAFLRSQKNPDTLEVVDSESGDLEVLLVYSRPSNPPTRRIVVERSGDRLLAYPPTRLDGSPLDSGRPSQPATPREEAPEAQDLPVVEAPEREIPIPTEIQNLECPIDPYRSDCRGLCVPGAPYEWCQ